MNPGFRSQVVPRYRLLTQEQIEEIHRASLSVLEKTGVKVGHDEGIELLRAAGCRVKDGNVVLFPNWLVEECIHSTPSSITMYNRKGEEAMKLEGRKCFFGLGTDLIQTTDLATGELRPTMLEDVVNAARVADSCGNIDFIASFALPHDVPTNSMYIECVRAQLENSVKPIYATAAGAEDLAVIIEMCETVAGGADRLRERPMLIHYSEPTPPLTHSYGAVRKLFLCADKGVPITYVPAAVMGGSAPVSLAGGIVQANAEALSGIVLHQLCHKGSPIISGFLVVPLDMRSGTFCYGAPETRLTNSAFADLYHYYGIPQWSTVGSDSHVFDQQAAMEHAMATLLAALDGSNLIHDVGYLGQGLVQNPAMLVMCDEIIAFVKRFLRGFDLSPELMALDVIHMVGPGGTYMAEDHTLQFYRQELWSPPYMNRADPDAWKQRGGKTYGEVITQRALQILKSQVPEALPGDLRVKVAAIARRAETELAGMTFKA
jgi:trimethylamine--corrinoid protein Co-methyltransferase